MLQDVISSATSHILVLDSIPNMNCSYETPPSLNFRISYIIRLNQWNRSPYQKPYSFKFQVFDPFLQHFWVIQNDRIIVDHCPQVLFSLFNGTQPKGLPIKMQFDGKSRNISKFEVKLYCSRPYGTIIIPLSSRSNQQDSSINCTISMQHRGGWEQIGDDCWAPEMNRLVA